MTKILEDEVFPFRGFAYIAFLQVGVINNLSKLFEYLFLNAEVYKLSCIKRLNIKIKFH